MLKSEIKMARSNILKGLFLDRRHSIYVAKRGNKGHRCRGSLGIQVPRKPAEVFVHLHREMSTYART